MTETDQIVKIGVLHPGNMGISVAASAQNSGNEVYWASEGRSPQTRERAENLGLCDAGTLAKMCGICSAIISVCPPHAAEDVAYHVIECGFTGLYLDANAISPERTIRIGQRVVKAGASFIDGSIIGGPAWEPGRTWLYLAGADAHVAASYFSSGPLETSVIGETMGKAAALKMCFAAYTKGSSALLCAIVAAAEGLGVWKELEHQWSRRGSDFAEQAVQRVRRVTAKAWRFAGEMEEISATFESVGVPGGFHSAASDIYRRITGFKDTTSPPLLQDVVAALLQTPPEDSDDP